MFKNRYHVSSLLALSFATVGTLTVVSFPAQAQTSVNCRDVFQALQNGMRGTGTVVGKSDSNYSMVQIATSPSFNPNTWNPAATGAAPFQLGWHTTHLRGNIQTVQTYSSGSGNPGWSGALDLWIYLDGRIFSRSITWGSNWTQWQDVRCFRAPGKGTHYGSSDPLQRVIVQAWNPYSRSFFTLDLVENFDLI